jgi:hypothetical protein
VRSPITRGRAPVVRLGLAALFIALIGGACPGCPARDLEVQVTDAGAGTLVVACESFRDACSPASCHKNHFLCDQITCELKGACEVPGNPVWVPEQSMGMKLLVLEAGTASVDIKASTSCVPLNLRPCIYDPAGKAGCATPVTDPNACFTAAIAQAVSSALGSGVSFSGFTSTDNVALVAAFFHKPGDEASCDASVLVNPNDCLAPSLTAVAGMGAPIGSSQLDITCASCQGGTHGSTGPDNAPCPVTTDDCFLSLVATALTAAGM